MTAAAAGDDYVAHPSSTHSGVSLFQNEENGDEKTRPIISFIINLNKINSTHTEMENATKEMCHKKRKMCPTEGKEA